MKTKKRFSWMYIAAAFVAALAVSLTAGYRFTGATGAAPAKQGITLSESGIDVEYSFLAVGMDLSGKKLRVFSKDGEGQKIYCTDSARHILTTDKGNTLTVGYSIGEYVYNGTTTSIKDKTHGTYILLPDDFGVIESYSNSVSGLTASFGLGQLKRVETEARELEDNAILTALAVGTNLSGAVLRVGAYQDKSYLNGDLASKYTLTTDNGNSFTLGWGAFTAIYNGKDIAIQVLANGEQLILPDDFGVITECTSGASSLTLASIYGQFKIKTLAEPTPCACEQDDCSCEADCECEDCVAAPADTNKGNFFKRSWNATKDFFKKPSTKGGAVGLFSGVVLAGAVAFAVIKLKR